MLGIAGIGAAVGGFTKGYTEGEKLRSDLEDAELRREIGKTTLAKAQREEEGHKRSMEIVNKYKNLIGGETPADGSESSDVPAPSQPAGIANPAGSAALNPDLNPNAATNIPAGPATAAGGPSGPAAVPTTAVAPAPSAGGIATPGASASAKQPKMTKWDALQKMYDELNMVGLTSGSIPLEKSLEMAIGMGKKFNDAKTDAAIGAMQSFNGTNQGEVMQRLSDSGINLPEGSKISFEKRETFPKSGMYFEDVVATSPDGSKSTSVSQLMRQRLDAKEWMNVNNDLGYKAAMLGWEREKGQMMYDLQKQQNAGQILHWKAIEEQQRQATAATLERLEIEKAGKVMAKLDAGRKEAASSVGFIPLADDKLINLTDDQKKAYTQRMMAAQAVAGTWEANVDIKTGNPAITISEAKAATQFANKHPEAVTHDGGSWFVQMGDKKVKVLIPMTELEKQLESQNKPVAPPAPNAPAAQQTAITPPGPQPTRPSAQPLEPASAQVANNQFRAAQQWSEQARQKMASDPDMVSLKSSYDQAIRAGKSVDANNILARINKLKADRYNLTPLGGIADPSRLQIQ